jgi:uncharacterized delta-60 repeat protein
MAGIGGSAGSGGTAGTGGSAGAGGLGGVGGAGAAGGAGGVGGIGAAGGAGGVGGVGGGTGEDPVIDYAGTVGAAGGIIDAQNGRVVLDFPAGALGADTDIRVSPLANVGVPGAITPTAYDFGPDGATFGAPVTLTLEYDEADLPAGVDEASDLFILGTSDATGELVPIAGSAVDAAANTVSAPIDGFSTFAIAISCSPGLVLDPWCPAECEDPAPTYPDDPGGDIDTSFGTAGKLTFALGPANTTRMGELLIDDQGKLLLAASALRMSVVRVLADGQGLDPSFGDAGVAEAFTAADSTALTLALRTDGRIILHGVRQPPGGGLDLLLARFLPNGTLDSSFGDEGILLDLRQGVTGSGQVATLPDGRVIATDAGAPGVYQFLVDGSPDPSFSEDGLAATGAIRILRRATGDWLLTNGGFIRVLEAQGGLGALYQANGPGGVAGGFQEIAGGGYVVGGRTAALIGQPTDVWAARFLPGSEPGSLSPDLCFSGDAVAVHDFGGSELGADSAVQSDGRVLVVGATGDRGDDDDLFVARIRPDGEVDGGFGTDGIVYIDFGGDEADGSIAIDDQGRIVVAGSSRDPVSGDRSGVVTRLLP